MSSEEIEKDITHDIKFTEDFINGCDFCCLQDSHEECKDVGNCSMLHDFDCYYIKSEIKS
jgi:hypothetical protein